jgi:hypothetical protein
MYGFSTVISPATAIGRIIATGYNPLQFVDRAYRDHDIVWAHQFEVLAHINAAFGMGMNPQEAFEMANEYIDCSFVRPVVKNHWTSLYEQNSQWFDAFSLIALFYSKN